MKVWATKEIQYLKKYALLAETNEVLNIPELAKKLNRTETAVGAKIKTLRYQRDVSFPPVDRSLSFDRFNAPYTAAEDKRIIQMYERGFLSSEIAEAVDRSKAAINGRVSKLRKKGKIKNLKARKWSNEEIELIKNNVKFDYTGRVQNYPELERILHRDPMALRYKMNKLRQTKQLDVKVDHSKSGINLKNEMIKADCYQFGTRFKPLPTDSFGDTTVIQVLVKPILMNGETVMEYRTQSGELLLTKKPTSGATEAGK